MTFEEVEKARLSYHKKQKKLWLILCIVLIVMIIAGFFVISYLSLFFAFFIFVLGLIIISFSTRKELAIYHETYKTYFVERNLRATFSDLTYHHNRGIEKNFLKTTNMINTGDVFHSNDYASGKYKNLLFNQADVHIQTRHTDSNGNTTYVTIFKGRFMIFEFPKKFNFKLELVGRKFSAYRVPGKNQKTGRKMEKIRTESSEFNSSFRIYSEDGFEAYYILDPAFMIKLMDISERFKEKVIFCFIDNNLIIGLNDGKDSFEPPKTSKPLDEAAENTKIAADIKIITDFVDQLSLTKKLFH